MDEIVSLSPEFEMILKTILEKCESLEIKKIKKQKEDFVELVFFAKDIKQWNVLFTDIFGQAVKPAGQKPSGRDHELTRPFRGIRPNQTLFVNKVDNILLMAMFWPWDDKRHVTLKVCTQIQTDIRKE